MRHELIITAEKQYKNEIETCYEKAVIIEELEETAAQYGMKIKIEIIGFEITNVPLDTVFWDEAHEVTFRFAITTQRYDIFFHDFLRAYHKRAFETVNGDGSFITHDGRALTLCKYSHGTPDAPEAKFSLRTTSWRLFSDWFSPKHTDLE